MRSMEFYLHATSGLDTLDGFWERHGLDRSVARLVFLGYKSGGHPHTLSIRWARSHADCSDVYITFEARRPESALQLSRAPDRKEWMKSHRITKAAFKDFLELIPQLHLPHKITARYAFPWKSVLDSLVRISDSAIRPTSLSFDLADEKGRVVLKITHHKEGKDWLLIVEPTWRFGGDADLIGTVYETGCSFARELGGQSR
jgi:hypothetical protein